MYIYIKHMHIFICMNAYRHTQTIPISSHAYWFPFISHIPKLHCDPPLHILPPPFPYFRGTRAWPAQKSSAACSGAQFFNFLGQDCCRRNASQPRVVASCHGSCSVVHTAGPTLYGDWQGFRIFSNFSHQASPDKGKLQILEVYVCDKQGQVFRKTAKCIFWWKYLGTFCQI